MIVNFSNIESMDLHAARVLAGVQQQFYDNNHSMVFCGFQKQVTDVLDKNELLEIMNVTPTESEAWDIVQMEEIEREYLWQPYWKHYSQA